MRKYLNYMAVSLAALMPFLSFAAVTVTTGPTLLINSPTTITASSAPQALFKFTLGANAGETLTGVKVNIANVAPSTTVGADLGVLSIYRDDGNGVFNSGSDALVGSQATVNVGTTTTVVASVNNSLPGTYFVTLSTDASWSSTAPTDSITVTLPADGLMTSANSPTISALTTSAITADTVGPVLTSVEAKNTGGTSAKEGGDSLAFTFNEATTKPVLSANQLSTTFILTNGHTLLDNLGTVMSESWNSAGTEFTVVLNGNSPLATAAVGDTVTIQGNLIKDATGNAATGSAVISGSYSADVNGPLILSAVAKNTGGTSAKEVGDTIEITFSENTNKPTINSANIDSTLDLSAGHSFLDSNGNLGTATWNSAGNKLTLTLSGGSGIAVGTVALGDTVTVMGNVIQDTSGNSASGSVTIRGTFSADINGPYIVSAVAKNTGGTSAKEAGDTIEITFSENTNKPVINNSNINTLLDLSAAHSFLDGNGNVGTVSWNSAGNVLTITLSSGSGVPSVVVGDTITVQGVGIQDTAGNAATGSASITGSFSSDINGPQLISAVAKNTGGTSAKEAGDTIEITFSENTNKPVINSTNIESILDLSAGHSFLDGNGHVGTTTWNSAGNVLTVTISSGAGLPSVSIGDTITVSGSVIQDASGNSASGSAVITGNFSADVNGPQIVSAVAKNTGGTVAKEAGDSIEITFSENTNKPVINNTNLDSSLDLSSGHTFLDVNGNLSSATWNSAGNVLTITLSAGAGLPTVAVGDTVTVTGNVIQDTSGNSASGSVVITGSFTDGVVEPPILIGRCSNGLTNGQLYRLDGRIYMSAACQLKIFNGNAVGHANGNKFQNIIDLDRNNANETSSVNTTTSAQVQTNTTTSYPSLKERQAKAKATTTTTTTTSAAPYPSLKERQAKAKATTTTTVAPYPSLKERQATVKDDTSTTTTVAPYPSLKERLEALKAKGFGNK